MPKSKDLNQEIKTEDLTAKAFELFNKVAIQHGQNETLSSALKKIAQLPKDEAYITEVLKILKSTDLRCPELGLLHQVSQRPQNLH